MEIGHIQFHYKELQSNLVKGLDILFRIISILSYRDTDININIYSNKKETSDFHGAVSFDQAKILQQK